MLQKIATNPTPQIYPNFTTIMPDAWISNATMTKSYGAIMYGTIISTSAANANINDHFDATFLLQAGTYTLSHEGWTGTDRGICTYSIDGISQGTLDWYASPAVLGVVKTLSVTIPASGLHKLTVTMASKNASSSDYGFYCSNIILRPAAY